MIHTCCIRELTYPPLGLLAFWMYILFEVCSLCTSLLLGSRLPEYIYVLLSSGPFMFNMHDITTSIPSPTLGPSGDPGVGMGADTIAPYLSHRFGSGHIPSSTLFAKDFHSLHPILTLVFTLMGVVVHT